MRFYKQPLDQQPHRFYCGALLHARRMPARGAFPFLRPVFSVTIFPRQLIALSPPFWEMAI